MTRWQTCSLCGKRKRELTGWWYPPEYLKSLGAKLVSIGVLWEGRVYACDRCTKPLEKSKAENDWAKLMKVKEDYMVEKQEKRKQDLDKILSDRAGWVRIKDITEAYNKLGHYESARGMSVILRENGFTQIKRRTHGYAYVFVT
jgi:hypothetical protein